MAALSKQVVDEFCRLCRWAHEAWATHRAMFDDNPHIENIRQLGRNEAFLDRISIITLEYVVRYGGWDASTSARLEQLRVKLDALRLQIKDARNKVICHNDLLSLLSSASLGAFTQDADVQYFKELEEFVSEVCLQIVGSTFEFGSFAQRDASLFMEALPRGEI